MIILICDDCSISNLNILVNMLDHRCINFNSMLILVYSDFDSSFVPIFMLHRKFILIPL